MTAVSFLLPTVDAVVRRNCDGGLCVGSAVYQDDVQKDIDWAAGYLAGALKAKAFLDAEKVERGGLYDRACNHARQHVGLNGPEPITFADLPDDRQSYWNAFVDFIVSEAQ